MYDFAHSPTRLLNFGWSRPSFFLSVLILLFPASLSATIVASPSDTLCSGDTVTLMAPPAVTYLWSTSDTAAVIQVAPSTTTSYSVTMTDSLSNVITDSITIVVLPQPVVSVSGVWGICPGDSGILYASGGTDYLWSTGDTTDTIWVAPLATTFYTVNVSNQQGCSARDSFPMNVFEERQLRANRDSVRLCAGDSLTLTCTDVGAREYLWGSGGNFSNGRTVTVSPTTSTAYILSAYPFNPTPICFLQDTVWVTVLPALTPPTVIRQGDSLFASPSGYTSYAWFRDGILLSASGEAIGLQGSGAYSVRITDNNGCSATSSPLLGEAEESRELDGLQIFPLPAEGFVELEMENTKPGTLELEIFDLAGKMCLRKERRMTAGKWRTSLHLSGLNSGVYLLKVTTADGWAYRKLWLK